ncbi:MAG: hypothetical protein R3F20_19100 [Planctomycetota bacterium]
MISCRYVPTVLLLLLTMIVGHVEAQSFPFHVWHLRVDSSGFGRGIAAGPDLDGDGRSELLIAAGGGFGAFSLHDGATLTTLYGESGGQTMEAVGLVSRIIHPTLAWLDDLDGDGVDDFAHGYTTFTYSSPVGGPIHRRGFTVRSGATGSPIWTFLPLGSGGLGVQVRVRALHDVTGDGVGELLVEEPLGCRIYDVASQTLVATLPFASVAPMTDFTSTVNVGGDVDGDGWPDFIMGSGVNGNMGQGGLVEVRSGDPASGFAVIHALFGAQGEELGGVNVGILSDLDGDGHCEFFASRALNLPNSFFDSAIVVYSGATAQPLFDSETPDFFFGADCRSVPDITADGVDDFAVFGSSYPAATAGELRFYDGASFSTIRIVEGAADGNYLSQFESVGDGNGDGFPEFVFGGAGVSPPGSPTGTPDYGFVWIESLFGSDEYGDPSEHALTLSRQPYSNPFLGPLVVGGGTPNGAISLVASYQPDDFIFPGTTVRVLLDVGAPLAFILDNLPLDANGGASFPLDLRNPLLDGTTVYLQAFDLPAGPQSSNAIAIRFGPQ